MHVIAPKTLKKFWNKYPDSEGALKAWFHEARNAKWKTSAEIKDKYRSASIINSERVVFNICGNKYRLAVRINYKSETAFIRFVGTHKQYDKIDVESV